MSDMTFSVEFYDSPRTLTDGPPFQVTRLCVGYGEQDGPLWKDGDYVHGVGYNKTQALQDLRRDCQALPSVMPAAQGRPALPGFRQGAIAAVDAALKECKNAPPASAEQEIVHAIAVGTYAPGKSGGAL